MAIIGQMITQKDQKAYKIGLINRFKNLIDKI